MPVVRDVLDFPVGGHVVKENSRARRTVRSHPHPVVGNGVFFRDVGFRYFFFFAHGPNLQLSNCPAYARPLDISLRHEGSAAILTWNDGENRITADPLARLNARSRFSSFSPPTPLPPLTVTRSPVARY